MSVTFTLPNFNLGTFDEIFPDIKEIIPPTPDSNKPNKPIKKLSTNPASTVTGLSNRFATVEEQQLEALITETNSKSTARNTSWGVRLFKQWLIHRYNTEDFENLPVNLLNEKLRIFYAEVRSANGEMYSKSSFVGLRAAIHRHLRAPPYKKNINILTDREFHSSNNVFLSVIRKLKKEGLDKSSHHMSISDGDMIKIRQYLSSLSPNNLLYKVWFDLMLGFASRGNENQRSFDKDTFVISTDDTGLRYISQSRIYMTKNHRGDLNDSVESKRRIYATGGLNCPVSSFELYISKLNPDNTCLFQSPKKHVQFEDAMWYNNKPLGTTTLKCMMKTISNQLGKPIHTPTTVIFLKDPFPTNPDLLYLVLFIHTQLTTTVTLAFLFGSKAYLVYKYHGKEQHSHQQSTMLSRGSKYTMGQKPVSTVSNAASTNGYEDKIDDPEECESFLEKDIQEEFRRLYTQLELLKQRNMKLGNRHLQHKLSAMTEAAQKEDMVDSIPSTPNLNGKRIIINLDDYNDSTNV